MYLHSYPSLQELKCNTFDSDTHTLEWVRMCYTTYTQFLVLWLDLKSITSKSITNVCTFHLISSESEYIAFNNSVNLLISGHITSFLIQSSHFKQIQNENKTKRDKVKDVIYWCPKLQMVFWTLHQ